MISKMTPVDKGGSVIGIVFNGSPLFNGDAGSGWSDIRKWIIQNDYLDAIVALPEDMFYNTNIATYLWIVRNNKPAHREGRITLVNGNQQQFRTLMQRNLGKKRVELTPATIAELVRVYRVENRSTAAFQKKLRHQIGHVLRYLQHPMWPDKSYHATREWRKWSK